jgi:hypothetical protein
VRARRADLAEVIQRTGLGFIPILITPEDEDIELLFYSESVHTNSPRHLP